MEQKRTPLYCDCHGDVVMGYLIGNKVFWYDSRHGVRHSISVEIKPQLDITHKPVV